MIAGGGLRRPIQTPLRAREESKPRVALVHDWLTGMRGGERCLEVLCGLFPDADIYTLIYNRGAISQAIESHKISTSFLQAAPLLRRHYRYLLPFFPFAIEGFDLRRYPLIISSSHCVAKGIIPGPETVHICYCLSPMRYVWDMYFAYFSKAANTRFPRHLARVVSHYLRLWDASSSLRVDRFAAVSRFVASRIWRYYRRRSVVIYPPVECSRFFISDTPKKDYYLLISATAPYKGVDLAVEAFRRLERPLRIVGDMSSEDLQRVRLPKYGNISLSGWVSQEELVGLYANCRALIFPGEEDFGLVPVEAQAAGRPVIAYGKGGARESVKGIWTHQIQARSHKQRTAGYTGLFFATQTAESLAEAVQVFESVEEQFEPEEIKEWAHRFDRSLFEKHFLEFVGQTLKERSLGFYPEESPYP